MIKIESVIHKIILKMSTSFMLSKNSTIRTDTRGKYLSKLPTSEELKNIYERAHFDKIRDHICRMIGVLLQSSAMSGDTRFHAEVTLDDIEKDADFPKEKLFEITKKHWAEIIEPLRDEFNKEHVCVIDDKAITVTVYF